METWTTYRLQDFLLFSERVYRRLFEAQNEAWWPLPIIMTIIGLAILAVWLIRSSKTIDTARQMSWGLMIATIVFVAVTFLRSRYAPISPIASVGYWAFLGEAVLLAFVGATAEPVNHRSRARLMVGGSLAAIGLLAYPAIGYSRSRALTGAEWFAFAPDPTMVALLGLFLMAGACRLRLAILMIVPIVWLIFSALTLRVFGDPVSWLLFGAIALAVLGCLLPAQR
ncbi:hypothetical protein FP2506_18434 [Fulvimarina pelagi HTCC2506]|uniref:Uncharacterized protein n=1 Tax=Fulvimarina pelagi HTCC2506 TaxID=314231 RepID=Q0G0U6_9HYPH|nr:DUF6064 family protein [Fulvimarina pelagi]EAU40893.1 hypothetical protein FP2506_18434 [Fulvimarina pelagi HTCC2506]